MPVYNKEVRLLGVSGTGKKNKKKAVKTVKKKPKKKLASRQTCIRSLDKYFSRFIRHRDSDEEGNISCVSCGKLLHRKDSHNCHFVDRAKRRYRRDEINCHAGCPGCNTYRKEFHMRHYTMFMIEKYGMQLVLKITGDDYKIQKVSTPEIREKLEFYKNKCKELGLI